MVNLPAFHLYEYHSWPILEAFGACPPVGQIGRSTGTLSASWTRRWTKSWDTSRWPSGSLLVALYCYSSRARRQSWARSWFRGRFGLRCCYDPSRTRSSSLWPWLCKVHRNWSDNNRFSCWMWMWRSCLGIYLSELKIKVAFAQSFSPFPVQLQ